MAKTKVAFLIGACFCGLLSLVLAITSLATANWITAVIKSPSDTETVNHAHHGLFTGTLQRKVLGAVSTYDLYATCSIGENVCVWSCLSTEAERNAELDQLYTSGSAAFKCTPASGTRSRLPYITPRAANIDEDEFMQAGLWVATIFFLSSSIAVNVVAFGFNAFNILGNPIEVYASTVAVPIYYVISGFCTLMTLILWGCEYSIYTTNNIAIVDTLVGGLKSEAELDWSFYLLLPVEFLQIAAVNLIYARQFLMNKKESETVIKGDDVNHDANTFMY